MSLFDRRKTLPEKILEKIQNNIRIEGQIYFGGNMRTGGGNSKCYMYSINFKDGKIHDGKIYGCNVLDPPVWQCIVRDDIYQCDRFLKKSLEIFPTMPFD